MEITDINNILIKRNKVELITFGRGFSWLDMGTFNNLMDTSFFIHTLEKRQGFKIGLLEEIAFNQKFINLKELNKIIKNDKKNSKYLKKIIKSI